MKIFKTLVLASALSVMTTAAFAQVNIGAGANVGSGATTSGSASGSANVKSNIGVNAGAARAQAGANVGASERTKVRKHRSSGSVGTTGSVGGSAQ